MPAARAARCAGGGYCSPPGRIRPGRGAAAGSGAGASGMLSLTGRTFPQGVPSVPARGSGCQRRAGRLVRIRHSTPGSTTMSTDRGTVLRHRRKPQHRGRAIAERFVAAGLQGVAVTARSGEGPEGTLTVRARRTDAACRRRVRSPRWRTHSARWRSSSRTPASRRTPCCYAMTEDDFDQRRRDQPRGAFRRRQARPKGMLRARWGRVVLISSVVGLYAFRRADQLRRRPRARSPASPARSPANSVGLRHHRQRRRSGFIETDMTAELPPERHPGGVQ